MEATWTGSGRESKVGHGQDTGFRACREPRRPSSYLQTSGGCTMVPSGNCISGVVVLRSEGQQWQPSNRSTSFPGHQDPWVIDIFSDPQYVCQGHETLVSL